MKEKFWMFLLCRLMLLLCVTCCATNPEKAGQIEHNREAIAITENNTNKIFTSSSIITENIVSKVSINYPFDPVRFVQELHGGMEVVSIFPDPEIESWVKLPGKSEAGRYYFDYLSPLYSKPINSNDETIAMINHQVMIARQLNPGYIITLDIGIRSTESKEVEKKTLSLNVQHGTRIQNYRREGMIKYTLKDTNGAFKYGAYVVTSAIVTHNNAEAEVYYAFQEWMAKAEKSEIIDLLERLIKK